MKLHRFFPIVLLLALSACAHHEPTPTASEPEPKSVAPTKAEFAYGGHCAASVKANRFDVMGDPKYTLDYAGKSYCFSSAKARDDFGKNIEKNVSAAERNWARHSDSHR